MDKNRYKPKEGQNRLLLAVVTVSFFVFLALVFSGCSNPSETQFEPVGLTMPELSFEIVDTSQSEVKNPEVTP